MKGIITIFALPQEIEDLSLTLYNLKRNSVYLDNNVKYKIEITLSLSDKLTNWEKSSLSKNYIKERSLELCQKYLNWCEWELSWGEDILGCVSQRRYSLRNNLDADFFIWLDCDFIFKDITLPYMESAFINLNKLNLQNIIITPQFVRQWDKTWDVLVNDKFINKPLMYHENNDVFIDILSQNNDIEIEMINDIKFAGGWFTLISKELLIKTDIPDSLGHYGLEDTFIIECSKILNLKEKKVYQFILKNLIIGESYTQRPNETVKKYISNINKKNEFLDIARNNFSNELKKFYERNNCSTNSL